jgi:hypothetical protein
MSSSGSSDELLFSLGFRGVDVIGVFKLEKIDLVLGRLNLILNLECRICWASG